MRRLLLGTMLVGSSALVHAQCDTINAKFEGESTGLVLSTLAQAAGYRLANPEIVSGKIDAEFEDSDASKLFPKLAWSLGYEVRIRGEDVWLEERDPTPPDSGI